MRPWRDARRRFAASPHSRRQFGSPYHNRPNGSASELDRRRDDPCAGGLRKGALESLIASDRYFS